MSSKHHSHRGPVYFCYAMPSGFSGQKEATEMVFRGLVDRGWDCRRLPQPVFEREGKGFSALALYAFAVVRAWCGSLKMLVPRGGWLCVNLGQTKISFIRDGVPLLVGRLAFGRSRLIVSLHGSLFMQWGKNSGELRPFVWLLRQAGKITVLGERQRARLLDLGLDADRIQVVVNSCSVQPLSESALRLKHDQNEDASSPIRILHLSSLIASKGFPEYLEALESLACCPGRPVEAVLCGRLVTSEFQERFKNQSEAETWIVEILERINRSERVSVRWIRGAVGEDKRVLFHAAHIFVLPTRYAVEAQPIVLLEAMASGCAVVTTAVGEIPTILDPASALFLQSGDALETADAISTLVSDAVLRARLAKSAQRRYVSQYEISRHLDVWERALGREPETLCPKGTKTLSIA